MLLNKDVMGVTASREIKPGYYHNDDRTYLLTGTKKGNKWRLKSFGGKWMSLVWTCVPSENELSRCSFSETDNWGVR